MIIPGRLRLRHVLRYIGRPLALLFAWDVAVTLVYLRYVQHHVELPALPLPLLGSMLAVYLSFRTSAAYARWWEARTLWGAMVNASRTLARELQMLLPQVPPVMQKMLALRHAAYIHALRLHLRREAPWQQLHGRLPGAEMLRLQSVANVPNAILLRSATLVSTLPGIDSVRLAALARSFHELTAAQGGMERIRNTPLPPQYSTYPVAFTHVFCILLPVGMVEALGPFTPLGSTAVGCLLLALLQIGNDMKNPFCSGEHDVPMQALATSIEIDLLDSLGETHQLAPLEPAEGVLW